eukprot:5999751-Pyramimonas_sp.AAC.1
MATPTLVQRSVVSMALMSKTDNRHGLFQEYFLAKPVEVKGGTANCLFPGIIHTLPKAFDILQAQAVRETSTK